MLGGGGFKILSSENFKLGGQVWGDKRKEDKEKEIKRKGKDKGEETNITKKREKKKAKKKHQLSY